MLQWNMLYQQTAELPSHQTGKSQYIVANHTMSDSTVQCMVADCVLATRWPRKEAGFGLLCLLCSILMVLLIPQKAIYKMGNNSLTIKLPLHALYSLYICIYIYSYNIKQIFFLPPPTHCSLQKSYRGISREARDSAF